MLNIIQFTCVLVVFNGISRSLGQTLPDEKLYIDNACYGSANYSYFSANCFTNHAIAVSKIKGGAKPYTTGCPPVINGTDRINFSICCVYSPDDCIEEFPGALKTYHDGCSGEQACKFGTSATIYRFVDCQEPLVNTSYNSYMELDYYCIDKTTIGSTCTSVSMTTSGKALYLWNNGYPHTTTEDCNCSIEVNSSTAQIYVTAMRIELLRNSSSCIRFLDGVCDPKETALCSDVSTITNIFTSTSNYLLMKYIRGHINDTGKYWIRFKATNSSANLTVQCQPEAKPVCTTTTSTTSTTSTTTSTTTPSTTTIINTTTSSTTTTKTSTVTSMKTTTTSGTTRNTTGSVTVSTTTHTPNSTTKQKLNEEKASESVIIGVIIGVVCLLLLIVVIVIIIYRRVIIPARNRKAAEKENKRVEQSTEPSDSNKESMIEQESFFGGTNSAPPTATLFTPRVKADTFTKERSEIKDDIGTVRSMQNIALSSMLYNSNVLGDHHYGNGKHEKKKSRKKKVKRKLVNEANQDRGDKSMQIGENSVNSLLEEQGIPQNDGRSNTHKKRKKRRRHHRDLQDDPQLTEHSWRGEENVMPYHVSLTTFEIYNENGEGTGRKNKTKKMKEKKRSARADDVDDQDLEQDKEKRHIFEIKVHPEHQGDYEINVTKEEKKKKKKKRKKHIEEEEGEEMKDGRIKIKQRHKQMDEGEGVQNGEEMKRERKRINENFGEEEKEIHNGKGEEGKKRKHQEEENGVLSEEMIREEITTKQEQHSEDLVHNDEDTKKKRKKRKKKQRHQKEKREDGHE